MTGSERVQSHMEKFGRKADVAEIAEDYDDDAVVEMFGTDHKGKDAIMAFFTATYDNIGEQEFTDVVYTENGDGSVEIDWNLGPMTGGDKFWFNDDAYFMRQRVFLGPKPEDW